MTIYGWDMSHFDSPDPGDAVAEGFVFITHKAGGDRDDPEISAWWNYVRDYGPECLLGAYWVLYPGRPTARADEFIARLNETCPGWRDRPFILQVDCEKWGGDPSTVPPKSDIQTFCNRLVYRAPKLRPIVYAPRWVYGDSLTGLAYPLWASSYVTGTGHADDLYPGDSSLRWNAYSGQVPAILQFSSSAIIAGQTTSDANAYRGTLPQLTALLAPGWDIDMTDYTEAQMRAFPWQYVGGGIPAGMSTLGVLNELIVNSRAQKLRDEAILAAVKDQSDTAEILARVDAKAAELAAQVGQVDEEVWAKVPDPGVTAAEKAALLRAVLGDDAAAVGELLAQSA